MVEATAAPKIYHKLIGFYSRDEKCLQRGTDWVLARLIQASLTL